MKQFNRAFFRDLWQLAKPYWTISDERWLARGLFALVIALNLVMVYMNYRITNWYNSFYNDMQQYKDAAVWHGVLVFLLLAAIFILAAVFQTYFGQMLQIRWRRWLTTRYLDNWLARSTYYHMQILGDGTDNPDQRISVDLDSFTNQTLGFIVGLIGSITTLVAFIALLWHLSAQAALPWHGGKLVIPGYLVWVALLYSAIGTIVIAVVGRPLIRLNFNQERYEADFRFSLVRLRENSDSVALYRGEERERKQFLVRFASLFGNFWQIMKRTRRLNWWSSGYGQLAIIFPLVVALPGYLAKVFELGTVMQIGSAF
ncbi:MAG TPA: SbmA/BacA-like family transporter, partial [Spirochaetia bacterium]|nr:SbmA/BacA-like family transporter [Spirochaetia bacterium]